MRIQSASSEYAPLRVAHIVLSMDCGGLERMVIDLVRLGQARGQTVTVICLERPGQLASELAAMQVQVICLDKRPGIRFELFGKLKRELLRLKPDVVHTHQIGALFYAGRAAHQAAIPAVVHTEHGKHFRSRLRTRVLGRLAARRVSQFVCVSHDIAQEVESCKIVPARKVAVIPNGIEVAKFQNVTGVAELRESLGIPALATVIGTVGRLDEVKRQDLLLAAFNLLAVEHSDMQLVIVGDGPRRAELQQMAMGSKYAERIHLVGYQADRQRYLAMMNIFALPSRSEGTPLSVLEAWAAGVPVVASRVGGLPDMLGNDEAGLLVEPCSIDALSAALRRVLSELKLRKRLQAVGLCRVSERYDDRSMAEQYDLQYRRILEAANKRALNS